MDFYRQHQGWVLFNQYGQPALFGDNFLAIMDPRPNSPWTLHLLDQFDQVLRETQFDGTCRPARAVELVVSGRQCIQHVQGPAGVARFRELDRGQ